MSDVCASEAANWKGNSMAEHPTGRAERIEVALRGAFVPDELLVRDDSALHAGHAGAAPGGETHFQIVMTSTFFAGMGRLARSRAVHDALADELAGGLHALTLRLKAPGE